MDKLAVVKVSGISGYVAENQVAYIRLEDAAYGLGIVKIDRKNGVEYKRIHTQNLKRWLFSFGLLKSEKDELPEYIPEPIFYMLAMKANNEIARAFQYKIAYEILPQIRQKGFYGTLTKENAMKLARKTGVTMDEYAEFKTGRSVRDRLAESEDWSIYRFSVADITADIGASHGEILNVARKKKIDKKKDLAKYVQGELRFTYQGRMVIEAELPRKPLQFKPVGEPIKWTFG